MKKRLLAVLVTGLFFLCITSMANATLTTIGTATYNNSDYNLIWDNDNNGNSVIWLDYTNDWANWEVQKNWAAELDSTLTYNINSVYSVEWIDPAWRLPSAGEDFIRIGYNQTTSEMGDLFYNDLELSSGVTTAEQLNAKNFDKLRDAWYWSGTEYANCTDYAWNFLMHLGYQLNLP